MNVYTFMYGKAEGRIRTVMFLACSFASFFTSEPLLFLAFLGISYYLFNLILFLIMVFSGIHPYLQLDMFISEKPCAPLQICYVVYGIVLVISIVTLPVEDMVVAGRMVSVKVLYAIGIGYLLWGVTRLIHNYKYYEQEYRKIRKSGE